MNIRTYNKIKKEGFKEDWLDYVKKYWSPKKYGKYEMRITSIEHLDEDPRDGIYIDTTRFDNAEDLSVILHFFEGEAYVMSVTETGEEIGEGIIDSSPFEECSCFETGEYDNVNWEWTSYTTEDIVKMNLKALNYYNRVEKAYHELVKKNRELKHENAILKERLAKKKD